MPFMNQQLTSTNFLELIQIFKNNISSVICGKENTIDKVLMAFLAGGHVLLEDVPGLGKTLLAKTIAKSLDAKFMRIQCTPDLLPTDITGVSIYNPKECEFKFIPGPVFTNVLLVDEINRAAPRTQSSLLEAMEERQVTIEGKTYKLDPPFFILATQNSIEYHGTFDLPEAQLDRFMVILNLGYPSPTEEDEILQFYLNNETNSVDSVISPIDCLKLQEYTKKVTVNEFIRKYIIDISNETRNDPNVKLGVSPRGSLALLKMSQACALINGRDYVIPDDVKNIAIDVLSHRVIPTYKRNMLANNSIIKEILSKVEVPE